MLRHRGRGGAIIRNEMSGSRAAGLTHADPRRSLADRSLMDHESKRRWNEYKGARRAPPQGKAERCCPPCSRRPRVPCPPQASPETPPTRRGPSRSWHGWRTGRAALECCGKEPLCRMAPSSAAAAQVVAAHQETPARVLGEFPNPNGLPVPRKILRLRFRHHTRAVGVGGGRQAPGRARHAANPRSRKVYRVGGHRHRIG